MARIHSLELRPNPVEAFDLEELTEQLDKEPLLVHEQIELVEAGVAFTFPSDCLAEHQRVEREQ